MAGDFPALHWWPGIIAVWAVAVIVVFCALRVLRYAQGNGVRFGLELFASVFMVTVGGSLCLKLASQLLVPGQIFVVIFVGALSTSLFRGPVWARRAGLVFHSGLVLSLLASHLYFSSLQSREGELRYGLQYGGAANALEPTLRALPLAELFRLTEKPMIEGDGASVLSKIIEERTPDLSALQDSELEVLLRGPMSDPLRDRIAQVLDERKSRGVRSP